MEAHRQQIVIIKPPSITEVIRCPKHNNHLKTSAVYGDTVITSKLPSTEMTTGLVFSLYTLLYLWLSTLFNMFDTACEIRMQDWTLIQLLGAYYPALVAITGRNSLQLHPQVSSVSHCLLICPALNKNRLISDKKEALVQTRL